MPPRIHQEDHDRDTACNEISRHLRYAKQSVKPEGASAYITDIEYKSASNN